MVDFTFLIQKKEKDSQDGTKKKQNMIQQFTKNIFLEDMFQIT